MSFMQGWLHYIAHLTTSHIPPLTHTSVAYGHSFTFHIHTQTHTFYCILFRAFAQNSSRGTDVIINRDKESLLWQLYKQLCHPDCGRQMRGCRFVMIWTVIFVHVQAHTADFYCTVVIFRKLPLTSVCSTLHAVRGTSLAVIPTGGKREKARTRERQQKMKNRQSSKQGEGSKGCFII